MTKFKFDIKPVEQARPRATITKKFDNRKRRFKNSVRMYDPEKVSEYKVIIGMLARQQVKMKRYEKPKGALSVRMTFTVPMLKSFTKKKTLMAKLLELLPHKKPDLSNYIKSTEDGLNGILWNDDGQICQLICSKQFGEKPSVEVEVTIINQNEY